jgi:AbrB family looped-hinge helix DNA binding protein
MRVTMDAAGRIVVPATLRKELGFAVGMELELQAVDGRLEVSVPSRVVVEDGPAGVRLTADAAGPLTAAEIRELVERGRR